MKDQPITRQDLISRGWENTLMKYGDCEVWRQAHERCLYDPAEQKIVLTFYADERHLSSNVPKGDFHVGERSHS